MLSTCTTLVPEFNAVFPDHCHLDWLWDETSQQWKPIMLLAIKDVKLTLSRRQHSKLYCLSYIIILTKLCLHSHHINQYLINGLLTNLQELLKYQYFTTCFLACNIVSYKHNLLKNCEILVCGLQTFSIALNRIRITFTASNWYFELC